MRKMSPARQRLSHEFVEFIPEQLQEGVLYLSTTYATAAHLCFCGCGREVVTPLSPTDWKLTFNGETVSLSPSIGNWSFPCRSHYWIEDNCVHWCGEMPQKAIDAGRVRDRLLKATCFGDRRLPNGAQPVQLAAVPAQSEASNSRDVFENDDRDGWFARLTAWFRAQI
ncbi:MAG: DUF6527 family protein [Betaproteobacteria bacterium]|nr:DUF6527 family protein [Betaproteobacteria bacterium]